MGRFFGPSAPGCCRAERRRPQRIDAKCFIPTLSGMRSLHQDQAGAEAAGYGFGAAAGVQLAENRGDVEFYRVLRNS
jgi:hypothetical protein